MKNNKNFDNGFPDFKQFTSSFNDNNSASFNDNSSDSETNPFGNIDMNTVFKMKHIMDNINNSKNNPRANLLVSLKPYLRPSRKQKIDQYIQLFNMSSMFEFFKPGDGEKSK